MDVRIIDKHHGGPEGPVVWSIENGLVCIKSSETATFEQWRAVVDVALSHPDYQRGMPVLHDLRKRPGAPSAVEAQDRIDVITSRAKRYGFSRWATIVSSAAGYGVGRTAEALASGAPVAFRVFRDPVEAEVWVRGGD